MRSEQEMPKRVVHSSRVVRFTESKLHGCFVVQFPRIEDDRGSFVKTVQHSIFAEHGLEADFRESYYSVSHKGVLRGMHFQAPPSDHAKLVYCSAGAIYDVALDLRKGSPTYGQHEVYELSGQASNAVYLPRGIAHGFFVREGPAVMHYHVSSEYDASRDSGIHWASFGAVWPDDAPLVSIRDEGFSSLEDFESPFVLDEARLLRSRKQAEPSLR